MVVGKKDVKSQSRLFSRQLYVELPGRFELVVDGPKEAAVVDQQLRAQPQW